MKITIYELLGMVKDGKAPKKVKYCDEIFTFNNDDCNFLYKYQVGKCQLFGCCRLNDEVEILEEEPYVEVCGRWFTKSEYDELFLEEEKKIPEKLSDILRVDDLIPPIDENMYKIWCQTIKNQNKTNEIIDYLKSKGE